MSPLGCRALIEKPVCEDMSGCKTKLQESDSKEKMRKSLRWKELNWTDYESSQKVLQTWSTITSFCQALFSSTLVTWLEKVALLLTELEKRLNPFLTWVFFSFLSINDISLQRQSSLISTKALIQLFSELRTSTKAAFLYF